MTISLDPEVAAVLTAIAAARPRMSPPAVGDWRALKAMSNDGLRAAMALSPSFPSGFPDVRATTHLVATDSGDIEARWYTRVGEAPGSAVVYAHGGGMISGDLDTYEPVVAEYVASTGVPFLSVGYRLAPEVRGETPARDVLAALVWLRSHAHQLGVDVRRIAVMGDSAGGGVAAGAARLARDSDIILAAQILVYPMLDHRTVTADDELRPLLIWTPEQNETGWRALLGEAYDAPSPVASPSTGQDLADLAPAFVEVGQLDLFCDESIAYAQRLSCAGVSTELHVHPAVPHAFERIAPRTAAAGRVFDERRRVLKSL